MIHGWAPASRRESAPISDLLRRQETLASGQAATLRGPCSVGSAWPLGQRSRSRWHPPPIPSMCPRAGNALIRAGAGEELTRAPQRGLNVPAATGPPTGSCAPTRPQRLLRCTQEPFKVEASAHQPGRRKMSEENSVGAWLRPPVQLSPGTPAVGCSWCH